MSTTQPFSRAQAQISLSDAVGWLAADRGQVLSWDWRAFRSKFPWPYQRLRERYRPAAAMAAEPMGRSEHRPRGGVSPELLAAQAMGTPASTMAPEDYLPKAIKALNDFGAKRFGIRIFREHEQFSVPISRAHRFRSPDWNGFLALAKDLARPTADSIDAIALQKAAGAPKESKLSSLKALEFLVAKHSDTSRARSLLGPFFGSYDLRQGDAHLPSSDLKEALALVGVDDQLPFVTQGYQLLHSCVTALVNIERALSAAKPI